MFLVPLCGRQISLPANRVAEKGSHEGNDKYSTGSRDHTIEDASCVEVTIKLLYFIWSKKN